MNFPHLRDDDEHQGLSAQLPCPLADGLCLDCLSRHAVHALPEAVGLTNLGLPQPEGAVLAATRIKLSIFTLE